MQTQKRQNDLSSFPRQIIQHHSNPGLCPNHWCQRSWSWSLLWRHRRPPRTNTKNRCSIHHWGLECKSRKSKVWLWRTKWSRAKANWILPRECTGHSKHPFPTTQETILNLDNTKWSMPKSDWLCSLQPKMEKLYTVSKTRPGADCGLDHELLAVKFRLKVKKVGKTTRPFRYDLN